VPEILGAVFVEPPPVAVVTTRTSGEPLWRVPMPMSALLVDNAMLSEPLEII
jgi:hypothetical protein